MDDDDANDTPDNTAKVGAPAAPDESDEEGDSQETAGREGQAQDAVVVTHNSCTTHTRGKAGSTFERVNSECPCLRFVDVRADKFYICLSTQPFFLKIIENFLWFSAKLFCSVWRESKINYVKYFVKTCKVCKLYTYILCIIWHMAYGIWNVIWHMAYGIRHMECQTFSKNKNYFWCNSRFFVIYVFFC